MEKKQTGNGIGNVEKARGVGRGCRCWSERPRTALPRDGQLRVGVIKGAVCRLGRLSDARPVLVGAMPSSRVYRVK